MHHEEKVKQHEELVNLVKEETLIQKQKAKDYT